MVAAVGEGGGVHGHIWGNEIGICNGGVGISYCSIEMCSVLFSMSADAHDWMRSRSALTGLGEVGSCEMLLVQADRMMLLRCLGQLLTEKTPIPARSGGLRDALPGPHRRHCGAIKSFEGELMALRCGAMPLLGT